MPTVKPTEEGQRIRLEKLKSLREDRVSLMEFAALKNYPEWAKLVGFLKKRIESSKTEEKNAAAYYDGEDISAEVLGQRLTRARSRQMAFEFIVECVEKKESQIQILDQEISRTEAAFKSAKEVLA